MGKPKSKAMLTVLTTKQQLKEIVREAMSEFQEEQKQKNSKPIEAVTDWITRNEAKDIIGVSLVTLDRWTSEGLLTRYKIGSSRIRYKRHEVESFFRKDS